MSRLSPSFRRSFASAGYLPLWIIGAVANAMLWLEMLAAALFVLEKTGSGWDVAVISAARALPLLGFGAFVGVVSDAWDRRLIVGFGLLISSCVATILAALTAAGVVQPWHLKVGALIGGFVYATEMPARRRLIAETVDPVALDGAVALDSLTNYGMRCLGPLLGGVMFQAFGLGGAFALSAACNIGALVVWRRLDQTQAIRTLNWAGARQDARAGLAFVRSHPKLLAVLGVTVAMNLFGFSYSSLVPLIAKLSFRLDPRWTGVLAAAEPAGAFLGGLVLVRYGLRGDRLALMAAGAAILLAGLLATSIAGLSGGPIAAALVLLPLGGFGTAIYTNNQTAIVIAETPPPFRSRVFGLVTVCIGSWPIGMLLAGALVSVVSPLAALAVLATGGLCALAGMRFAAPGASAVFRPREGTDQP